jgi:hypothetical protein
MQRNQLSIADESKKSQTLSEAKDLALVPQDVVAAGARSFATLRMTTKG